MQEIKTERLLLRPLTESDVDDVVAYANDEEMGAYIPNFPHPYDHDHAREFVEKSQKDRENRERYEWAIVYESRVVGAIGLSFKPHGTGEIGYAIGKPQWGKGIASEALQAVVNYAFETEDLHRLQARTFPENAGSQKVLQKTGFRLEGRQREIGYHREKRHDELLWALLKSEWKP